MTDKKESMERKGTERKKERKKERTFLKSMKLQDGHKTAVIVFSGSGEILFPSHSYNGNMSYSGIVVLHPFFSLDPQNFNKIFKDHKPTKLIILSPENHKKILVMVKYFVFMTLKDPQTLLSNPLEVHGPSVKILCF